MVPNQAGDWEKEAFPLERERRLRKELLRQNVQRLLSLLALAALALVLMSRGKPVEAAVQDDETAAVNINASFAKETPDFDAVMQAIRNHEYKEADQLLKEASRMNLSEENAQRLERVKLVLKYAEFFYNATMDSLRELSPPAYLCNGEYLLIEFTPSRVLIRNERKTIRFTKENPTSERQNLYDIIYRHKFAGMVGEGNMEPAIGCAVLELLAPDPDRSKALQLFLTVNKKGTEKDRETFKAILTELHLKLKFVLGGEGVHKYPNNAAFLVVDLRHPDFDAILKAIGTQEYEKADQLLEEASRMTLTGYDSLRAKNLKSILEYAKYFREAMANSLAWLGNKVPAELCDGQYGLVEVSDQKVVIRIDGKNIKFTPENPTRQGYNLYDIIYRHQFARLVRDGNMEPALGYAIFELFSPDCDSEKVLELLKTVRENGSERNLETLKTIFSEFTLQLVPEADSAAVEEDAGQNPQG